MRDQKMLDAKTAVNQLHSVVRNAIPTKDRSASNISNV